MVEAVGAAALAVGATVAVYALAQRAYLRSRSPLLNPTLIAILVLIAALRGAGVPYALYERGGQLLGFFLGPAVVALGVPLALQWDEIRRHGRAMGIAIPVGGAVGVISAAGTAALLGASPGVVRTLATRSATTPIALGIAERVGGIPPLAAALVIGTGVFGAVIGPALLRVAGVRSRTAWGLAMGAAAHGIGTARAAEEGEVEGAVSGLTIGLMGLATAVLVPLVLAFFP